MDKKAFTLTELITGMIVSSIVLFAVSTFFSLNSQIVKKAQVKSRLTNNIGLVSKHFEKNLLNTSLIIYHNKNHIELYSHSYPNIRYYLFENGELKYKEGNSSYTTLIKGIDSDQFFKCYTAYSFYENAVAYYAGQKCAGVKVKFWEKCAPNEFKTKDIKYFDRYFVHGEASDIIYCDSSNTGNFKNGTRVFPLASIPSDDSQGPIGPNGSKAKVLLISGKYTFGYSSSWSSRNFRIHSLYVNEGVTIDVLGNSAISVRELGFMGSKSNPIKLNVSTHNHTPFSLGQESAADNIMIYTEVTSTSKDIFGINQVGGDRKRNFIFDNNKFSDARSVLTGGVGKIYFRGNSFNNVTAAVSGNIYTDSLIVSDNTFINTIKKGNIVSLGVSFMSTYWNTEDGPLTGTYQFNPYIYIYVTDNYLENAGILINNSTQSQISVESNVVKNANVELGNISRSLIKNNYINGGFYLRTLSVSDNPISYATTVENNTFEGSGVYKNEFFAQCLNLYNNIIKDTSGMGLNFYGERLVAKNNMVFAGNTGSIGLHFKYSLVAQLYNNIFFGGLHIGRLKRMSGTIPKHPADISYNTFYDIKPYACLYAGKEDLYKFDIKNSIIWKNTLLLGENIFNSDLENADLTIYPNNNIIKDNPLFISADNGDFRTQNPSCSAIGAFAGPDKKGWDNGAGYKAK